MDPDEFEDIKWNLLPEIEYQAKLNQCNVFQKKTAQIRRKEGGKAPLQGGVAAFSPEIGVFDWNQMDSPFTENKEMYDDFSPQYWFDYFFKEAKKTQLQVSKQDSDQSKSILNAIRSLFDKVEQPGFHPPDPKNPNWKPLNPRGYRFVLKDGLRPIVAPGNSRTKEFTFLRPEAANTWRSVLMELLKVGFEAVPIDTSQSVPNALQNCMLDSGLVQRLNPDEHEVHLFWRGDGRKSMEKEDWTRTVDEPVSVHKYHLDDDWHPYSDASIRAMLWLRKAQGDNDYYTIVSVTAQLETAACFPKITESRAYPMPLKAPSQWTAEEIKRYGAYLAEVEVIETGNKNKIMLVTKSFLYMMAINRGVFVNTEQYGKQQWKREAGFPERGVTGVPKECYIGMIPVLRIWHGYDDHSAFTTVLSATETPLLFLTKSQLEHRFGSQPAAKILTEFEQAKKKLDRLTCAWSSVGASSPPTTAPAESVIRLAMFPLPEFKLKGMKLDTRWR